MSDENVLVEERDGIAFVTINRPRKLNNMDTTTVRELHGVFRELKEGSSVRGVIVTGAGQKAFVSGADIEELADLNAVTAPIVSRNGQACFDTIENLGKPVIAAVNGYALGGGCELAMACTLRTASEKARFGLPEVKLGILPGYGGTQRLARLVGKGRAMELVLTGELIDAVEAHRIGLVNKVFPPDALLEETEKWLRETILTRGPIAVQYAIQAVNRSLDVSLSDGQYLEAGLFGSLASTKDYKEGMTAFMERRKPEFRGE
jgi:enoyl-CoA hydratase